jgi:hypothetical protein
MGAGEGERGKHFSVDVQGWGGSIGCARVDVATLRNVALLFSLYSAMCTSSVLYCVPGFAIEG